MTRRTWMLGVTMLALTAAGGVWAGLAWANAGSPKAEDCCLDPTCPPGCSEVCPPDCIGPAAIRTKTAVKTSCCCDDPTCPPGCTPECAAECLPAAKTTEVRAKKNCPPCPFCP